MNIPDCLVCPSCNGTVKPLRRKAPRFNSENVSPIMDFGWFCPVEGCNTRLDKSIAALQSEIVANDEPTEIDPNDISADILPRSEEPIVKTQPKKVVPIRQTREPEDLFGRIQREHREAVREENDLKTRLVEVAARREKLDRLMAAMNDMQMSIATE
jgi:hypothetical protein